MYECPNRHFIEPFRRVKGQTQLWQQTITRSCDQIQTKIQHQNCTKLSICYLLPNAVSSSTWVVWGFEREALIWELEMDDWCQWYHRIGLWSFPERAHYQIRRMLKFSNQILNVTGATGLKLPRLYSHFYLNNDTLAYVMLQYTKQSNFRVHSIFQAQNKSNKSYQRTK
jgi:hypothetical protein